jgi:hypothetical protein
VWTGAVGALVSCSKVKAHIPKTWSKEGIIVFSPPVVTVLVKRGEHFLLYLPVLFVS